MTTKLHKLTPESIYHEDRSFWFDDDGVIYYGRDEESLMFPNGLEIMGNLPDIHLADIVNAFKLGLEVGKEQGDV